MKNKVLFITLCILSLAWIGQAQTSPETAQKILGDHFIGSQQAVAAWQSIDPEISLNDQLIIPYSEETLKWFQTKTACGKRDFYLVPTLGLSDSDLEKFWDDYQGLSDCPEKTEITYRLINLKPLDSSNSTGFKELSAPMIADGGRTMPMMDYLEIIATISLVTGKNLSFQSDWLMLSEESKIETSPTLPSILKNFKGKLTLAYSTIINGSCHDVIVSYFPLENFIGGNISNHKISLLATESDQTEDMILIPLKTVSCLNGEKRYFVGLCYYIKPQQF